MRFLLLLIALICAPLRSEALEYVQCPKIVPFYRGVHEHQNTRIRAIFEEVYRITGMTGKKFAICETDEFNPGTFPIPEMDGRGFSILLPHDFGKLPVAVIRGSFAHELGHLRYMDRIGGRTLELNCDELAVQWVGKDAVIESLRAMLANIERFPKWAQGPGRASLEYRINALVYGLYEYY